MLEHIVTYRIIILIFVTFFFQHILVSSSSSFRRDVVLPFSGARDTQCKNRYAYTKNCRQRPWNVFKVTPGIEIYVRFISTVDMAHMICM